MDLVMAGVLYHLHTKDESARLFRGHSAPGGGDSILILALPRCTPRGPRWAAPFSQDAVSFRYVPATIQKRSCRILSDRTGAPHMIVTNTKRWMLGSATVGMALLAWPFFGRPDLTAQQTPAWSPAIVTIPSPAGSNSGAPQLMASDRGVLLSWVDHDASKTTLRFAERTPAGWTEPRVVASGEDWSINAIDVPSVPRDMRTSRSRAMRAAVSASRYGWTMPHRSAVWMSRRCRMGRRSPPGSSLPMAAHSFVPAASPRTVRAPRP